MFTTNTVLSSFCLEKNYTLAGSFFELLNVEASSRESVWVANKIPCALSNCGFFTTFQKYLNRTFLPVFEYNFPLLNFATSCVTNRLESITINKKH